MLSVFAVSGISVYIHAIPVHQDIKITSISNGIQPLFLCVPGCIYILRTKYICLIYSKPLSGIYSRLNGWGWYIIRVYTLQFQNQHTNIKIFTSCHRQCIYTSITRLPPQRAFSLSAFLCGISILMTAVFMYTVYIHVIYTARPSF